MSENGSLGNSSARSGGGLPVADKTFKEMEHAGWTAKAPHYDGLIGRITRQCTEPLLDAARVGQGMAVLDIATGPGYGAGAAAARGARAVGIDFSETMVAEARKTFPGVTYEVGDGENLGFAANSFDAVICPFGLLHMPEPDRAISEAFRVLKPGGRYGFSVWTTRETHQFFALVLDAVEAHGDLSVPLPPAPSAFRFSDHDECKATLAAAGFADTAVTELPLVQTAESARDVLDLVYNSSVRTVAVLALQTEDVRARIHDAIHAAIETYRFGDHYRLIWPAVIASGRKP